VHVPSASASDPGSPSRGVSDVEMPSLFQFSAVDAASAVDYSKNAGLEDGVVDSPPAKLGKRNYSPSPLRNNGRALIDDMDAPPPKSSVPRAPRSSRRLCMDEHRMDVPQFTNVPPVIVPTPVIVPDAQTNAPKAKVPNFQPS